jgi:hypothetical protein
MYVISRQKEGGREGGSEKEREREAEREIGERGESVSVVRR